MEEETPAKWQPVMLIIHNRLECKCGSLAIFVQLFDSDEASEGEKQDWDYKAWCQSCFQKAQEEVAC